MEIHERGSNSVVECLPSKQGVAGSNPVSRSISPRFNSCLLVHLASGATLIFEPSDVVSTVPCSECALRT